MVLDNNELESTVENALSQPSEVAAVAIAVPARRDESEANGDRTAPSSLPSRPGSRVYWSTAPGIGAEVSRSSGPARQRMLATVA